MKKVCSLMLELVQLSRRQQLSCQCDSMQELFISACRKQPEDPGRKDLKLSHVNDRLDELMRDDSREGKKHTLQWLINHTTPDQMMWLVRIILGDLKVQLPYQCHADSTQ